ncbi:MAG: WD40 repeat domain-containing protein [Aureliella sp.]
MSMKNDDYGLSCRLDPRLDGTMSQKLPKNASIGKPSVNHLRQRQLSRRAAVARVFAGGTLALGGAITARAQDTRGLPKTRLISKEDLAARQPIPGSIVPHVIELQPLEETDSIPVVTALASDASGSYLAIAGDDHAVRIYSTELKRVIRTVKAHVDWIHALQFDSPPAGSTNVPRLYSAGDDGFVYCWQQGQPPVSLAKFEFAIRSLSFSTDRNLLAVGGFDERIVLFDTQSRRYKRVLTCDCGDQRTVRFSPDGSQLLCGGRDGEVNVWNSETGQKIACYAAHSGRIHTASFSSSGDKITSVGEDRRLVQYDLAAQRVLPLPLELPSKLMSMSLINDSIVAIAGADNSIQLYDFNAEQLIANLTSHEGTVAVLCPVGKMLASGSFDTTVRIWDLEEVDAQRRQQPVRMTPIEVDDKLRIR